MLPHTTNVMSPLSELRREMDRLLDGYGMGMRSSSQSGGLRSSAPVYPAMNAWDTGDTVCVEAEVPGISKDGLEVYAVGNELTIKGQREAPDGDGLTYHRQERCAVEFTRALTLPFDVDADHVEAELKDGVLTVRLPKAETAKPKRIAVATS